MVEEVGNVKVVCRFRPLNEKERKRSEKLCVRFTPDKRTVIVSPQNDTSGSGALNFSYDAVFGPDSRQVDVYNVSAKPIVEAVMQGFNGTVFAYGQTSSGKTFTMTGNNIEDSEMMGIIPRMVNTVFEQIAQADEHIEYSVKVSYTEIYLEKIRDLLDTTKQNLQIHEDRNRGIYIADLTETYVSNDLEVYNLMKIGSNNREVSSTNMNAGSSRSHAIFVLTIAQTNTLDYSAKSGKLYLVDLAGSEKVGKTGAEGKRLEEAKNINKSLTTLGLVIYSLTDGKSSHIPYRDSKLTRVLQDSLGGNSKTALIITCSPAPYNEAETISTLRFGLRAKSIKNKPKVNREYTVAELKLMLATAKEEIAKRDRRIMLLERTLRDSGLAAPLVEETKGGEDSPTRAAEERVDQGAMDEVICELEDTRDRLSEEVEEHSRLKTEAVTLRSELGAFTAHSGQLQELCEQQKAALESSEAKCAEHEDAVENFTVSESSLKNELELLNSKKLQLEQQQTEKTVEIEQLQSELAAQQAHGTSRASQDAISTLSADLHSQVAVNSILEEKVSILQTKLDEAYASQLAGRDSQTASEILLTERTRWEQDKTRIETELALAKKQAHQYRTDYESLSKQMGNMENNLTEGERALRKRTETLERNLEQLTLMYHQLCSQKSILKVDKQVNERKIQRLTDKNKALEAQFNGYREALLEERQRVKLLSEQLEALPLMGSRYSVCGTNTMLAKNIKKVVKGGGGKHLAMFSPRISIIHSELLDPE